jgi:hypothetical protein
VSTTSSAAERAEAISRPCPFPGERGPRKDCTCTPCWEYRAAHEESK